MTLSLDLGASVWTKDIALAKKATREIEAGSVFVNTPVKSDPRLPFEGLNALDMVESFQVMELGSL